MKALTASFAALAALAPMSQSLAAVHAGWATATRVTVTDDQTNIFINAAIPNPSSCGSANYIAFSNTLGNYQAITSTALTAVAGSFEVYILIDETGCYGGPNGVPRGLNISFRN